MPWCVGGYALGSAGVHGRGHTHARCAHACCCVVSGCSVHGNHLSALRMPQLDVLAVYRPVNSLPLAQTSLYFACCTSVFCVLVIDECVMMTCLAVLCTAIIFQHCECRSWLDVLAVHACKSDISCARSKSVSAAVPEAQTSLPS